MDELIRLCRKAANAWRNTDTYHQASVLIDSLCDRLEKYESRKPMTNADRIRAMSDEELAEFLAAKFSDLQQAQQFFNESSTLTATQLSALSHLWYCAWMQWLKQPVKDGDNDGGN